MISAPRISVLLKAPGLFAAAVLLAAGAAILFAAGAAVLFAASAAAARPMEDMNVVVVRSIDKLSARTHTFDIPVGRTVQFGKSLFIKVQQIPARGGAGVRRVFANLGTQAA